MRLHQVIALEKARKPRAKKDGDGIYHAIQKHHLAGGNYGTYTPASEDEAQHPLRPGRGRRVVPVPE